MRDAGGWILIIGFIVVVVVGFGVKARYDCWMGEKLACEQVTKEYVK